MKKQWRSFLWRWHRRLGLGLIVVVMWLSATGILLNHTDFFNFAHKPVYQSLILKTYGIERPSVSSYLFTNQWFSHSGEHLYHNGDKLTHCQKPFSGMALASEQEQIVAVSCAEEILLVTTRGDLVERINKNFGLPPSINQLGTCGNENNTVCFKSNSKIYQLDVTTSSWVETTAIINPIEMQELPDPLQQQLNKQLVSINWERVILDLHSGRLFGLGPWLMDGLALLLIVLGFTGIGIWLTTKKRK